jgi:hypothetical protein
MKQLELVTIRRQPMQPEIKIPTRVIKAYVRENLRGFARRQALRERTRQERREREAPRKPRTEQHMRTIKVTYRAVFEQPIGALNPMGVKLPGPQPVEVCKNGTGWEIRELSTPKRRKFERLGKAISLDDAQARVQAAFSKMLTSGQIWGTPPLIKHGTPQEPERQLSLSEICDLGDGTAGWYTAEDRTHIIHAPSIPPGKHVPPAACGAELPAKCFVNNRANAEPTCPGCAEVWKKEYKDR